MLNVVIDTNVIISALLSPDGHSALIVDKIFDELLKPVYYEKILIEYTAVLARPRFHFSIKDQINVVDGLKKYGIEIQPLPCDFHFSDESDRIFYEAAKSANAYLVTGNARHFPDDPLIINPAKCVDLMNQLYRA